MTTRAVVGFLALQPFVVIAASKVYREKHRPQLPLSRFLDLHNKSVLVTGASSGIGEATVLELKKLGATVVTGGRHGGDFHLGEGGGSGGGRGGTDGESCQQRGIVT